MMVAEHEQTKKMRKKVVRMEERRTLPIGNDNFRKLRENGAYYVDKTLMIKEFIETKDEVALVARPRRFGKTLNMTMLREFFDITEDSREIFEGLAIMDTEYADQINSRPVIFFTFKDCKGATADELMFIVKQTVYQEYLRYEKLLRDKMDKNAFETRDFYEMIEILRDPQANQGQYSLSIQRLTQFVKTGYGIAPILLIDEYDQPIMSSYEYGYHDQLGPFFSNLYGSAMKGNPSLDQALIT
ncbi:AAA family ATPase, partial [Hungatella hathewayi]|uniref:AAA family ATPase n=1 Tax=Hungatella hathewayi TaxID=154046 RepID=UPI0026E38EEC